MAKMLPNAVRFFYRHAGWSRLPHETEEQGRMRGAKSLARAERDGIEAGLSCSFDPEPDPDPSFMDPLRYSDADRENATFVMATVYDVDGNVVASLSNIHEDARQSNRERDPYRRVVRAELFAEALENAPRV